MACRIDCPLHAITGTGTAFLWGREQQQAFNSIKIALIESTALAQPDSDGEFVLETNASDVTISGSLHQRTSRILQAKAHIIW